MKEHLQLERKRLLVMSVKMLLLLLWVVLVGSAVADLADQVTSESDPDLIVVDPIEDQVLSESDPVEDLVLGQSDPVEDQVLGQSDPVEVQVPSQSDPVEDLEPLDKDQVPSQSDPVLSKAIARPASAAAKLFSQLKPVLNKVLDGPGGGRASPSYGHRTSDVPGKRDVVAPRAYPKPESPPIYVPKAEGRPLAPKPSVPLPPVYSLSKSVPYMSLTHSQSGPVASHPGPVAAYDLTGPAGGGAAYDPAPAFDYQGPQLKPHPLYDFSYGISDEYAGNAFGHREFRDGYNTEGSYYVKLPDTRLQKVDYAVVGDSGYVAQVSYEGEAKHPVPQKGYYDRALTQHR